METWTPRQRLDDSFPESVHAAALAVLFIAICYAATMFVLGDARSAAAFSGIATLVI